MKGKVIKYEQDNIDTDVILPGPYLKLHEHAELAEHAMEGMDPDFHSKVKNANIIVTGKNFGCGSSREHAPWALLDFGIKCVIGPSFADIFYNNCFKNGMLPVVLDEKKIEELIQYSERKENIEINLTKQEIMFGNKVIQFDIEPFKKHCLLNGIDDIALSLKKKEKISFYENELKKNKPWIN